MTERKGLLVRVGIDQTYGRYNAPINPVTNDYLYMPIPQDNTKFTQGMETTYGSLAPFFQPWCVTNGANLLLPPDLNANRGCHLDPDFDYSTYGDQASGRGLRVGDLNPGDFIAFFASFKPIIDCGQKLIYALFGFMTVDKRQRVADVPYSDLHKNAHTRIENRDHSHWVIFADPSASGRFDRAIPIGEFRNGAYRVTNSLLDSWGGIGVKDGFIQRSVCPPWFLKPDRFLDWYKTQQINLIRRNWI